MKLFFLRFFTWWSGTTFGTLLWTRRFGEVVGQDEGGNTYYRTRGGKIDPTLGFERRWVIYNGSPKRRAFRPLGMDGCTTLWTRRRPRPITSRASGKSRTART